MAKGFDELDRWVNGLAGMEKRLGTGMDAVFQRHETRYRYLAMQASTQFLLSVPNQKIEAEVWAQRVEDFVNLIFSRLVVNGFEIFYQGRAEDDAPGNAGKEITYDDVLKWVEAGAEHGGKDITATENNRGRSAEQIAYDVHTAIRQHRLGLPGEKDYGPITERLERWVEFGESGNYFLDLLPQLLGVWETVLAPVVAEDFDDFVDEVVGAW